MVAPHGGCGGIHHGAGFLATTTLEAGHDETLALMTELESLPIDSGPLPPQLLRAGRAQVAASGSFSVPSQRGTPARAHGRMAPLRPVSR